MARIFGFETLGSSDLVVDAVYESSNDGALKGEPIGKLLPGSGNMGGFRIAGKGEPKNWVALFTTGEDADWPDTIDPATGQFVYYGDNKKAGHQIHDTSAGGNKILKSAFERLHDPGRPRDGVPPFFIFLKHPTPGRSRSVQFKGVAVPGYEGVPSTEDLVAVWKSTGGERFQNYRAVFTILDIPVVEREWILELTNRDYGGAHAPKAWTRWRATGKYAALKAPPTTVIRTTEQQLPDTSLKREILMHVWATFKDNPIAFESFAARVFRLSDQRVTIDEVTRATVDGGRDAIGRYRLGVSADPVYTEFSLEAKCYEPPLNGRKGTTVGVTEMARLISRIRHRQFGVLVTTSVVARQAYQEIRDDRHPIVIFSARDLTEVLIERGFNTAGKVDSLVAGTYESSVDEAAE